MAGQASHSVVGEGTVQTRVEGAPRAAKRPKLQLVRKVEIDRDRDALLGAGLVGGGAAGLPPVALPTLPNYPLYIATNADSNPQQSIGSGPYELTATSETDSSEATAVGGFQIEAAGNVALVKSNATISASADGTSVTATSDVQGLSIGPLDIGEISSSATETLEPDGTVTPSSSMTITGIEIGGLPIGVLVPNGLEGAGETIPLPINSILAKILSVAGISATVETAQTFSGTVDSPALQITMPVTVPSIGPGTVTLTFGSTSASMVGSASASDGLGSLGGGTSPSSISTGSASSQTASPSSTTTSSLPVAPSTAGSEVAGAGLSPPSASSAGNPVGSSQVASPTSGSSVSIRPVVASSPQYTGVFGVFGIKTLYLVVTLGALASLVISQLIRILGIRRPWTYNGG